MNTHATIEVLPFICNCEVNTSITIEELLGNGVFFGAAPGISDS
jgi:hypothetical protein